MTMVAEEEVGVKESAEFSIHNYDLEEPAEISRKIVAVNSILNKAFSNAIILCGKMHIEPLKVRKFHKQFFLYPVH